MTSCESFWYRFLKLRELPLPREVTKTRLVVSSFDTLLKYLKALNGHKHCFVSVYSLAQQQLHEYDVLFFETDDLESTFEIDRVLTENKIHFVKFFSGKKGYHYYVPLMSVSVDNFRRCALKLLRKLGIDQYLDDHCTGDVRRMARMPYTVHPDTGLYSVYVPPMCKVNLDAMKPTPPVEIPWKPNRMLTVTLLGLSADDYREQIYGLLDVVKKEEYYPECILHLIEKAHETKYLSHEERLHLGAYLLKIMSIKDAVKFFECLEDFDERVTLYHLNKMKNSFRCYTCTRAKALGICPMKNQKSCVFYPSINLWVK